MDFYGLTWQAWITIVIVLAMFASMIFTKIKTEVAFLLTMAVFYITGILDEATDFSGFSAESVVVVAVLFIVIAGLTYSGVLNWIVNNLMGTPKSLSMAIARLMLPVALLSSVLSNTTVVALFINVVKMWSKKLGIAPSKLLIPLSYASGMGGICTLIGTPPNLIISGLYAEDTGIKMGILTPALCGIFCLFVGVLSMIAMQKLLPKRVSPMSDSEVDEYTAELVVPADSLFIGMTVKEALAEREINTNDGTRVVGLKHYDDELVMENLDDEFIMGGDRLIMTGKVKTIQEYMRLYGFSAPHLKGILDSMVDENVKPSRTLISALILIAMVVLSAFNILPLLTSCMLAAIAMVVCRCCNSQQAMKAIDWNIIIVFAGSLAIGKAIENTGIAQMISNGLLDVCGSNPYVVLTVVCLVATFITEFISNTAAGAMFYPIAMSAATTLGVNPVTFCVGLMIAASSSFATPIGSPTHMLVYIPGGYRFTDFAKVGIPMNFIILAANVFITTLIFPFH